MLNECYDAFNGKSTWNKGRDLAYGLLNCMGRHTLTGMLTASGKQFLDWSSHYRLFSDCRINIEKLFDVICKKGIEQSPDQEMIVAHMDDTIIKKTGKKIPGTAWRRDPLGPPFHINFIWGQRFLQISLAIPQKKGLCQSRAIPIDFHHCPTIKKPQKNATAAEVQTYKLQVKEARLSNQGALRIKALRQKLDQQGFSDRMLTISVDGSYSNREVLKNLPDRTCLIGRIRKDTKLYLEPNNQPKIGRKRGYGQRLPTPEEIRQSDQFPWQQIDAWAAGKKHSFAIKSLDPVLWRSAGQNFKLRLIIIRPLGYRLSKDSKILYRQPAYLISTNPELDIQKTLQAYLWRWEIEVNFREEKSLLGCGQAQVRNVNSIVKIPAFTAAIYGLLHLAAIRSSKSDNSDFLPRPKWYPKKNTKRPSTSDLVNNNKAQAYSKSIGLSFSSFVNLQKKQRSLRNSSNSLLDAMLYCRI